MVNVGYEIERNYEKYKLDFKDIIELPVYILSLVLDYKMYLRNYSTCMAEIVLYCI